MNKTVKTTAIEKKYKDKTTGEWKILTIHHAKVNDRVKAFWEDNPRGKIETSQAKDGAVVIFKASILADKSDEYSREATGHSYGEVGSEKNFEKLETIAVGRALALLGYAANGEIASVEEMEEYMKYNDDKKQEALLDFQAEVSAIKTIEELRLFYMSHKGLGKEYEQVMMNHNITLTKEA